MKTVYAAKVYGHHSRTILVELDEKALKESVIDWIDFVGDDFDRVEKGTVKLADDTKDHEIADAAILHVELGNWAYKSG